MSDGAHRGEISIGSDEWIPYFELAGRHESAVEVDFLLRPTFEMWAALETQCVAGCCGIEAFDFWPEQVRKAAGTLNVPKVVVDLGRLRAAAQALSADVLLSRRLNCYFDKRQFVMLIEHLLRLFGDAAEA